MQNPIGEADLEWILHRNCEGTEQLQRIFNFNVCSYLRNRDCLAP